MDSDSLKSVIDLPPPFQSIFSFRYFNLLQSDCFSICYHSDVNMVVSAPTGSGKTVLFELCILRLLSRFMTQDMRFIHAKGTLKAIYIAPSKALVQEKLRDWNKKFGSWGISCLELTGDNEAYNTRNLQEADIILTTPEKFDAVTRYRINDGGLSFFSDIALVLIDEVHLLNEPRGAALEAIVSRIKGLSINPVLKLSPLARVRLLAVSATIPNLEELAEWLMVPPQGIKRFGEEIRPVKLTTRVLGYTPAKNDFLFEQHLQNFIFDILMQYSKGKSALVFCSTRKGAQEAAQRLTQTALTYGYSIPFIKSNEQQERLREASLSCSDKPMQSCIPYGVAYHHGGLSLKDRSLVEGLFPKGDVQVLCTTNTLAHGINLPAHTVVIKSTRNYNKEKGHYMEYDRSTVLQMCGRAGRPPFDDTGTVVIMTRKATVHLYEDMLNGCEVVESQLLPCITEHLTAEIVQLTISDITRAIEWIKCSYLYVRTKKDLGKYSVKKGITNEQIEKHMQEICVQKVNELAHHELIWNDEDGFLLKPLEPGRLMTKYYLRFNTMKYIMQAPASCTLEAALRIVCRAEEIACMPIIVGIQLRRNEKKLLNDINVDKNGRLRFHVLSDNGKPKKRIQTTEEKIFVLANDFLTGDPLVHDLSMTQNCQVHERVFHTQEKLRRDPELNPSSKIIHHKLWDDSQYLLKQLPGIGMVTAKALHSMGVNSFEKLAEADPRKIEIVTGRKYPFGNQIKETLQSMPPKVEMEVKEINNQKQGTMQILITLTRLSEPVKPSKRHYADMVLGSEEDDLIHFHEKIRVNEFNSPYNATVLLSHPPKGNLTIKADLIFEEYLGIDVHKKLVLKDGNSNSNPRSRNKEPLPSNSKKIKLQNSGESKRVQCSTPSFNLIDEEFPEDAEAELLIIEGEDEDCKIISETTVFDHIRVKAKSYPVISTSNSLRTPSPQLLNLTRKRSRGTMLEPRREITIENSADSISKQSLFRPLAEPAETGKVGFNISCTSPSDSKPSMGTEGMSLSEIKGSVANKPLTEDTIFDLIKKKSKNFPVLNGLKITECDPFSGMEFSSYDRKQQYSAMSNEANPRRVPVNSPTISDMDIVEKLYPADIRRKGSDLSPNDDAGGLPVVKMASGRSPEIRKKLKSSPKAMGSIGNVLEMAGKTAEANSFLGFKSVFSFL